MNKLNFLILSLLVFLISACESTTLIQSRPQGATVYVNGQKVGSTPYLYMDEKVVFSKTPIRLEHPGYESLQFVLCRNEQPEAGPIVGAFFTSGITLLWGLGYYPDRNYDLRPIENNGPVLPEGELKAMASELKVIKDLYDQGILSAEEYAAQKKRILKKYGQE
jgi:hypothetical protein